ncbi:Hypothetical_protein [Hexamita inflata]|uniref:Hypothetical_protein n=1 Tax=Hexamita inflata TaxID=28002 RepID=A0AA86P544_9EUKA|nr:Hypothetical protein HINF_LOCUS19819 [Hexamita inflata]
MMWYEESEESDKMQPYFLHSTIHEYLANKSLEEKEKLLLDVAFVSKQLLNQAREQLTSCVVSHAPVNVSSNPHKERETQEIYLRILFVREAQAKNQQAVKHTQRTRIYTHILNIWLEILMNQ